MAHSRGEEEYQRGVERSFQEFFQSIMPSSETDVPIKLEQEDEGAERPERGLVDKAREQKRKARTAKDVSRGHASVGEPSNLDLLHKLQKNLHDLCQQRAQNRETASASGSQGMRKRRLPHERTGSSSSRTHKHGKRRPSVNEVVDLTSDTEGSPAREESAASDAPQGVADDLEHFRIKSSSTLSLFESGASETPAPSDVSDEDETDDDNMRCSMFSVGDVESPASFDGFNIAGYRDRLKSIGKENGSAYRHAAGVMARILSLVDRSQTMPVVSDDKAREILEGENPPPVVVVEGKSCEPEIESFLDDLETFHNTVSVQDSAHIGNKGRQGKKMSTGKLRQIFRTARTSLSRFQGKNQSFQQPVNCLGMSNPNPDKYRIQAPTCLSNPRWQLLQILCRRLSDPDNGFTINLHEPFVLLSQEDAITLPHQDRHGCTTYVQVVRGSKVWIYWDLNKQERLRFRQDGLAYCSGRPRIVFLEEGQTLIMRPGTVHAVITTSDSLCFGGQAWDGMQLTTILKLICEEVDDQGLTTNENPATGLYEILQEAQRITRTQRTKKPPPLCFLRASHSLFEEALSKVRDYCYDGEWQSRRKQRKRKETQ